MHRHHNYNHPINYVCPPMPDEAERKRIRIEGIPYEGCKKYSVAFRVKEDGTSGEIIYGWTGYAYECPIVPFWDTEGPWSILQTEFLTE